MQDSSDLLELCNIRRKDVDLGAIHLMILGGKNRKDRVVNISAECTKVLFEYLSAYRRQPDDFLFATLEKEHQLASGDLRKMIRTLARRAKIDRRVFPDLLRHSLATNLLNRGASLMIIQGSARTRLHRQHDDLRQLHAVPRPLGI